MVKLFHLHYNMIWHVFFFYSVANFFFSKKDIYCKTQTIHTMFKLLTYIKLLTYWLHKRPNY